MCNPFCKDHVADGDRPIGRCKSALLGNLPSGVVAGQSVLSTHAAGRRRDVEQDRPGLPERDLMRRNHFDREGASLEQDQVATIVFWVSKLEKPGHSMLKWERFA